MGSFICKILNNMLRLPPIKRRILANARKHKLQFGDPVIMEDGKPRLATVYDGAIFGIAIGEENEIYKVS